MYRTFLCVLVAGLLVVPAFGQPGEWQDDFTTVATYDVATLLAPCYGGGPTKYTLLEAANGDPFNSRAVSGGGRFLHSNRLRGLDTAPPPLDVRFELAVLGWLGLGIGCPGEPAPLTGSANFTSPDVCLYGAMSVNRFFLGFTDGSDGYGADGRPGDAGVDDDQDGTVDGGVGVPGMDDDGDGSTDNWSDDPDYDESPASAPILTGGTGYAPPGTHPDGGDGTVIRDGLPGFAGVDDDGDGITDEQDEIGMGDDSDDSGGRHFMSNFMKLDLVTSSTIWINFDPGSGGGNLCSIRDMVNLQEDMVEATNEIVPGFYQPDTTYNYTFCVSGTCYGGVLWTKCDMANPNETLGPVAVTNRFHDPASGYVGYIGNTGPNHLFSRDYTWKGNSNFSETYWVCSGKPTNADFAAGVFGYPSPSADLDQDRDVDVNDFLTFSGCFAGSLVPPAPGCANTQSDLDCDGDVDVNDFLTFSSCFAGSLTRPNDACFPPGLMNGELVNCP